MHDMVIRGGKVYDGTGAEPVVADIAIDGDRITVDAEKNEINVDVSASELSARKAAFVAPPFKATRGTLAKYIRCVKSASEGCVTDEPLS